MHNTLNICHLYSISPPLFPLSCNSYNKVLEEGIAEILGPKAPVGDDTFPPSLAEEHAEPGSESEGPQDLALDDPVLTLGVSLGGEDERMLNYYAGQVRNTPSMGPTGKYVSTIDGGAQAHQNRLRALAHVRGPRTLSVNTSLRGGLV